MSRLTERDGQGNWMLKGVSWKSLSDGAVITKNTSERLCGALCKLKDYEDTETSPKDIEELKYYRDEQMVSERLKTVLKNKIKELKGSSGYPHNFKGQMVEDFEWVLSLLKHRIRLESNRIFQQETLLQ